MRTALLLALALAATAAEPAEFAGLAIDLPPELEASDTPPPGTLACWRSADGRAAIAVVERRGGDLPQVEAQAADLLAHGQAVELLAHGAADLPRGWHRLHYRLTLGEDRYEQDARILTTDERQVVVTASWPVAAAEQWQAPLTTALDGLASGP